ASRLECKQVPLGAVSYQSCRIHGSADVLADHSPPEVDRRPVHADDANLPPAGQASPRFTRRARPDPTASIASEHEELGHVPDVRIAAPLRSALDEDDPRQRAVDLDEKRVPVRAAPVEREALVTEPAVVTELELDVLAEVMRIELE